jgi:DNA repair photolyase
MLKIKEIQAKQIITKSGIPGADYVVNPYVGCQHSCLYCYAVFMKRFTNHAEPWGEFIDVKTNAPDLIPSGTNDFKGKTILLSSVTDPYLPLERKYQLTRRVLEKLLNLEPDLSILTKSDLVTRDIDILKKFKDCEVGFSIMSTDNTLAREVEPLASPPSKRIDALKEVHESGIRTYVFVCPLLPELSDWKEIIRETKAFTDHYMFDRLNMKRSTWPPLRKWLREKHPELLPEYESIYFSRNDYWETLKEEIREFSRKEDIRFSLVFR